MNKGKKLINTLAALSGEITVRSIEEMQQKNGRTRFDICVSHCHAHFFKSHFKHIPELYYISFVNHTECAESECAFCFNLSWINRKTTLIAIVMNLLKIPVRIIRLSYC